jgi:hypothetical protein
MSKENVLNILKNIIIKCDNYINSNNHPLLTKGAVNLKNIINKKIELLNNEIKGEKIKKLEELGIARLYDLEINPSEVWLKLASSKYSNSEKNDPNSNLHISMLEEDKTISFFGQICNNPKTCPEHHYNYDINNSVYPIRILPLGDNILIKVLDTFN